MMKPKMLAGVWIITTLSRRIAEGTIRNPAKLYLDTVGELLEEPMLYRAAWEVLHYPASLFEFLCVVFRGMADPLSNDAVRREERLQHQFGTILSGPRRAGFLTLARAIRLACCGRSRRVL